MSKFTSCSLDRLLDFIFSRNLSYYVRLTAVYVYIIGIAIPLVGRSSLFTEFQSSLFVMVGFHTYTEQ